MTEQQNYTLNTFKNAYWLVYLNGLEVPVVSVSTSFEVWKFPTASIEMVPHPCLQRLGNEDRIQVAVFFLDVFKDPGDPTFRLLGEFEITGWSYSNSSYGRSIQLNCVSHLQIFAQLFFFYMSSVDDVIVGSGAAFGTAAHAGSGAKVFYPSSLFISGLVPQGAAAEATEGGETKGTGAAAKTTSKKAGPAPEYGTAANRTEPVPGDEIIDESDFIRTPLEFITNVFKALTAYITPVGSNEDVTENPNRLPPSSISYMGRNFFGRWLLTTRFHRRWAALPLFEDDDARRDMGCFPLVKAIGDYHILRIMQKNVMSGVGQAQPVWGLLQMIYGNMYMDVVPIPAPAAVREHKKTWDIERELREGDLDLPGDPALGIHYKTAQTFVPALTSFIVKPQSVFGIPPKCNIIFPSMVKNLVFQEDYMNQPTRLYMGETLLTDLLTPEGSGAGFSNIVADQLTTGYPNIVRERMKAFVTNPKKNTKNFILYAEEFFKGPNTARINAPPWLFLLAQAQKKGGGGGGGGGGKGPAVIKGNENERFSEIKEIFEALSAAGTVTPFKGAKIPTIPAGALWGLSWTESQFVWNAQRPGGMRGYMQILPSGRGNAGIVPAANVSTKHAPQFDWNKEFHALMGKLKNSNKLLPDPKTAAGAMLKYYDDNLAALKGSNMFTRAIIKPLIFDFEPRGFNIVLGYLYLQSVILYTFALYGYKDVNWNDAFASYSALGVNGLKRAKAKMKGKNKAGLLPPGKGKRYAKNCLNAWAKFSGVEYGTGGCPKYEDSMDLTDYSTVEIAEQSITYDMLGETFDLFAKYEYFRQKYVQRSATVSMVFNPYIVPGFPCVIIDEPQAAISFLGYVTGVSHVMSAAADGPQMTTQVSVSFMRTLGEYIVTGEEETKEAEEKALETVKDTGVSAPEFTPLPPSDSPRTPWDPPTGRTASEMIVQGNTVLTKGQFKRFTMLMDAAAEIIGHPHEPIEGVRDVFQRVDEAEELYARLFYPGEKIYFTEAAKKNLLAVKKRHLFHVPDFYRVVNKEDETDFLARELLLSLPTFELKKVFKKEAFSYDAAMKYVARPSCSLHNYVRMWHRNSFKNGVPTKLKKEQGIVLHRSHPSAQAASGKATYYYPRIYKFRAGPVPKELRAKKNKLDKVEATAAFKTYIQQISNVDLDGVKGPNEKYGRLIGQANKEAGCLHPETRFDWDEVLEQYLGFLKRKIV